MPGLSSRPPGLWMKSLGNHRERGKLLLEEKEGMWAKLYDNVDNVHFNSRRWKWSCKNFKTYYYMKSDMSCQINPFDD